MAMGRRKNNHQSYAVYWCTTREHREDWFVVASSAAEAARFHEAAEGERPGSVFADRLAPLPARLCGARGWFDPFDGLWTRGASWPSARLLELCGATITAGAVRFEAPTARAAARTS